MSGALSTADVARRVGVSPATLRRWAREGLVPDGEWTPSAVTQARMVARLRERGHSIAGIREAIDSGRLVFGFVDDLFPLPDPGLTIAAAARETGLEPELIERLFQTMGFSAGAVQRLTPEDVRFLRYVAAVLDAGFPLVAFLQLARVYGQSIAQVADAEVRLLHLYVHEPLMRDGAASVDIAEEIESLVGEVLPLASPIMDYLHQRLLQHFVEQDVIGHMEADTSPGALDLGHLRVAIAFADLAGYTRLTEEEGDEEAVNAVESFIAAVEATLPDDARVIKTIGDEVMIVGSDAGALTDWAVGFQTLYDRRPQPRIGVHVGECVYRDGDYYGREVNLAARVAARSGGGEVLVTRPVADVAGRHLRLERIGEVRLKGFSRPTELFLAGRRADD